MVPFPARAGMNRSLVQIETNQDLSCPAVCAADFPFEEHDFSSGAGGAAKLPDMPDKTHTTASLKQLETALDYVAAMIDERPEGEAYLCIYVRLEEEIAAVKARHCVRERARARARERRAAA